jgi:hypothetical protein
MRTTVYIKEVYCERLMEVMDLLGISKDNLVSLILDRITVKSAFKVKTFETVNYQKSCPDTVWETMHVRFNPVVYEKAQDMRNNYKFSVSWFLAYGIVNFLDEIVSELTGSGDCDGKVEDGLGREYVSFSVVFGGLRGFFSFWGDPGKKFLKNLKL